MLKQVLLALALLCLLWFAALEPKPAGWTLLRLHLKKKFMRYATAELPPDPTETKLNAPKYKRVT
jgi:hypothetical protein